MTKLSERKLSALTAPMLLSWSVALIVLGICGSFLRDPGSRTSGDQKDLRPS